MDGHEIGLALNKKILSTLKTLTRLIGPEASINNILASAIAQQAGKREDGIYAVYEGNELVKICLVFSNEWQVINRKFEPK